jgi:SprT protein
MNPTRAMAQGKDFPSVTDRTLALLKQAERHFHHAMPKIEIRFDLRGKSAGMVRFQEGNKPVVRYNMQLLSENHESFISQTVPHEVAHVVARSVFGAGIRPHGAEWRTVMAFFGSEATRCHEFDVSRSVSRRLRRFSYRCTCREHQLTSIRHNRVLAGQTYQCRICRSALTPCPPQVVGKRIKSVGDSGPYKPELSSMYEKEEDHTHE